MIWNTEPSTLINKYVLLAYVLQNVCLVFYRGFILSRILNETGIFSGEDLLIFNKWKMCHKIIT
jgi:hypothetical protein